MRKTYAVILSIFFISILVGAYFMYFQKAQIKVGDEDFNMWITYDSYFLDQNGNKLALVTADGSVVDRYHLDVHYLVNGKEINWDTLTVHVYCKLEITLNEISPESPAGERALIYNETLLNVTTSKRESSFIVEKLATELVTPIAEELQDNATITINIIIRLWATAYDIYAIMRYANWRGFYSKSFIWDAPEMEIQTPSESQDSSSDSSATTPGETVTDYDLGYKQGYQDGYDAGVADAKAGVQPRYTEYSDHKGTTYDDGYNDGYQDGYVDGYKDASPQIPEGGSGYSPAPPTDWHDVVAIASSLDTEGMREANTTKAMMIMAFSALLIGAYWIYDTKIAARGRGGGRRR